MIYTIFLYQSHTGLLIYDKSFQNVNSSRMEMFSSFFSAIKTFISELVLEGSKELKNIELGDYSVLITSIPDIKVDLVVIADKEDTKIINKLIPKIIKLLLKYQNLFLSWDGDREEFSLLDHPLVDLISSNVKDVRKTLLEKPESVLKSMWTHKKRLSEEAIQSITQERKVLLNRIQNTSNLIKKKDMVKQVLELSEKLRDEGGFLKYQKDLNSLKVEIKDAKFKSEYYLNNVKKSVNEALNALGTKPLREGDYKDTYMQVYSFSSKLKLLKDDGWKEYRELANNLIKKDEIEDNVLSETLQKILKMSDNIEDYLN